MLDLNVPEGTPPVSCHSTPGNLAVLSVARHAAGNAAGTGRPLPEAAAQRSLHTLLREARDLTLPDPDRAEVDDWFERQHFAATLHLPGGRTRQTALAHLDEAYLAYRNDEATLDPAAFHAWKYTTSLTSYTAQRVDNKAARTIAVDMDGCIYNFNSVLREWLVGKGWDRDTMPDPEIYDLHEAWNLSNAQLQEEMAAATRAGLMFRHGMTYHDGAEGVRDLGLAGHQIIVNSARLLPEISDTCRAATVQWLRDNDLHPDGVHLARGAHPADKLGVAFDLLIDDHAENVRVARAAGRHAVLLDRPWNKEHTDVPRATYPEIVANLEAFAPTTFDR